MGKRHAGLVALWLAMMTTGRGASADVVSPPPTDCTDGTTPNTGHCGPYCEPTTCTSDETCNGGTCQSVSWCIVKIVCAGRVAPDADLSAYERSKLVGACASGQCAQGECQSLRVCMTGAGGAGAGGAVAGPAGGNESADTVLGGRACGCRFPGAKASGSSSVLLWWLGVPVLIGFLGTRRNRSSRTRRATGT